MSIVYRTVGRNRVERCTKRYKVVGSLVHNGKSVGYMVFDYETRKLLRATFKDCEEDRDKLLPLECSKSVMPIYDIYGRPSSNNLPVVIEIIGDATSYGILSWNDKGFSLTGNIGAVIIDKGVCKTYTYMELSRLGINKFANAKIRCYKDIDLYNTDDTYKILDKNMFLNKSFYVCMNNTNNRKLLSDSIVNEAVYSLRGTEYFIYDLVMVIMGRVFRQTCKEFPSICPDLECNFESGIIEYNFHSDFFYFSGYPSVKVKLSQSGFAESSPVVQALNSVAYKLYGVQNLIESVAYTKQKNAGKSSVVIRD